MRKYALLRLMLALALLSATVPLSLGAAARPEQVGPQAAFNRLQARSNSALTVNWDARSDVPNFLTGLDPATRLPYQPTAAELGNPIAIARGFLDENRALFKLAQRRRRIALPAQRNRQAAGLVARADVASLSGPARLRLSTHRPPRRAESSGHRQRPLPPQYRSGYDAEGDAGRRGTTGAGRSAQRATRTRSAIARQGDDPARQDAVDDSRRSKRSTAPDVVRDDHDGLAAGAVALLRQCAPRAGGAPVR